MSKVISFLRDVKIELSKVSWPTGSLTARFTLTVIAMSIVVALFLGVLDQGLRTLLQIFI